MFDLFQHPCDEGDFDEEQAVEYIDGLMEAFAESPESQAAAAEFDSIGWAETFLYYALRYRGEIPPAMSEGTIADVLYEIFPRKVSVDPDEAEAIVGELRAFWQFLDRVYQLPQAGKMAATLDNAAASKLRRKLDDSSSFGMAKSFFMMGRQLGFDMTSQEGLDQFMLAYNARLLASRHAAVEDAERRQERLDYEPQAEWSGVVSADDRATTGRPVLSPQERAVRRRALAKRQAAGRNRKRR